jgi:mannose/fructose/N-acetylgalactosamine-specific phosphotransferase system component IIC
MQPNVRKKIRQRRQSKVTAWHWLALGLGTAFVLTASMTTAYRWLQTEVQELLKEAERLLAQGRGSSGE